MNEKNTFTLTNFRLSDEIPNWPLGSNKRGVARFEHEANKRGQRISRTTTGKPKFSRYFDLIALADGSDGKTHMIGAGQYGGLCVMACDMQYTDFYLYSGDENYTEYLEALRSVATLPAPN